MTGDLDDAELVDVTRATAGRIVDALDSTPPARIEYDEALDQYKLEYPLAGGMCAFQSATGRFGIESVLASSDTPEVTVYVFEKPC